MTYPKFLNHWLSLYPIHLFRTPRALASPANSSSNLYRWNSESIFPDVSIKCIVYISRS